MRRVILGLFLILFLGGCTFTQGTTKDVVQGFDKGIIWHHLYLLNDHTTAYCFDNDDFIPILKSAQESNQKVTVTYETNLIRGILCTTSDKFERVVVTNVVLDGN